MPAKPLTEEQQRDASRLRAAFELWKSSREERGEPTTQDAVSDLFGMGQSALSQYLGGKIPLNAEALDRFSRVLGVRAANISPSLVRKARELAESLESPVKEDDASPFPVPEKTTPATRSMSNVYMMPPRRRGPNPPNEGSSPVRVECIRGSWGLFK